ncbi:hypothetical protein [Streptomyces sp. BK340]|nr:hypothetical protein [Streptomyces sp. BK340]
MGSFAIGWGSAVERAQLIVPRVLVRVRALLSSVTGAGLVVV